jgi:RNA polymerase sigma factor, sigma-70 family
LDAAKDNDFQKIYAELMPVLFKVAYNIVRAEDIAEDLCHDSLIKMVEKQMQFPSLNDAKFWLIRVVKNASLNQVKRKGRERKAYAKAFKEDTRKMDTGEEVYLKTETSKIVNTALDLLPDKLKIVLQLKEYGDLNYKEIGRILGITEGNVKVRVFRARERLASLIGESDVYMS